MSDSTKRVLWSVRAVAAVTLLVASVAIFSSAFASPTLQADSAGPKVSGAVVAQDEVDAAAKAKADEALAQTESGAGTTTEEKSEAKHEAASFGKGARLMASFTVFLLAVFVGVEVINKVPPTLHTPLMSGSNAISGITIIGALLTAGHIGGGLGAVLGMIAAIFAMINVVGGFLVTHRMLLMFKKR